MLIKHILVVIAQIKKQSFTASRDVTCLLPLDCSALGSCKDKHYFQFYVYHSLDFSNIVSLYLCESLNNMFQSACFGV